MSDISVAINILNLFVLFFHLTELMTKQNRFYSAKYEETFRRSIDDPETFWAEVGDELSWSKRWEKVLDNSNEPFTKW